MRHLLRCNDSFELLRLLLTMLVIKNNNTKFERGKWINLVMDVCINKTTRLS